MRFQEEHLGLPLLHRLVERLSHHPQRSELGHCHVIFCHHILTDAYGLARSFKMLGAHIYTLGVRYGEPPVALEAAYKELGPYWELDLFHRASRQQTSSQVQSFLRQIQTSLQQRFRADDFVLIMEDGGFVIEALNKSSEFDWLKSHIRGAVEQTTKGMWLYEKLYEQSQLTFPSLTVARSKIKTYQEPIFIGQCIAFELQRIFNQLHQFIQHQCVLILGYGVVGKSLLPFLTPYQTQIYVCDTNPEMYSKDSLTLSALPNTCTFSSALEASWLKQIRIILGCTGQTCFTTERFFELLTQTPHSSLYFVSTSSAQIEFLNLIELLLDSSATNRSLNQEWSVKAIDYEHIGQCFILRSLSKRVEVYFLGYGLPITFANPQSEGAPNRGMDAVISQMFLAAAYVATSHFNLDVKLYVMGQDTLPIQPNEMVWFAPLKNERALVCEWCEVNEINSDSYLEAWSE